MKDNNEKSLSVSVDPSIAGGNYSNLAIISHSRTEFIIDFAYTFPGIPGPKVNNRIVMAPEHVKRLLNALTDNIRKYEASFGPILLDDAPKGTLNLADMMPGGNTKS